MLQILVGCKSNDFLMIDNKGCYPNTCEIFIKEYGLKWGDKVIVYIIKEIIPQNSDGAERGFEKYFMEL